MALRRGLAAPAAFAAAILAGPAAAAGWLAGAEYQADSESLLSNWKLTAGLQGLAAPGGSLDLALVHHRQEMEKNRYGLQGFEEPIYGVQGSYAAMFGAYGLALRAGYGSLEGWKDYTAGGDLSRYWLPFDGWVLRLKANAESRVNKDNPIMARLGLRTLTSGGAAILSSGPWYLEAAGSARFLDGLSNAETDRLAGDTAQVGAIPRNRILSAYIYGYRTLGKTLTLGGFSSWADSRSDFYRFIRRGPGQRDAYMYFPYDTPLDSYAFGALVAVDLDLESRGIPAGAWSAKVTYPFHSRRDQFWQVRNNFGIPMFEGYFAFNGEEPLTAEVKVRKALGPVAAGLAYRLFLKPYVEYGHFDSRSYRVHAVELTLGGT